MTGAVCEVARYPSSNMTKQIGEAIDYFLSIKNCGNTSENFFYLIKKNGATIKSRYNHQLPPGVKGSLLSGSFTMGSSSVKFDFIAGFAVGGSWVTKYSRSATISPGVQYANFKVYVRNQNNSQPISGAKVVCAGVTKYTGSDGYTSSFRTVMFTTVSYTVSKSGFQTTSRSCYINRDNDLCTPYLDPVCSCGGWVDGECLRDNYRAQTRVCTPSGCDSEWREHYDPSCVTETHSCQIGALIKPSILKQGEEITVKVPVKNTGNVTDKFDVQLVETDTGKVIDTEPDIWKRAIAPGATSTIEVNSIGWIGAMPNHLWKLDVIARRIT